MKKAHIKTSGAMLGQLLLFHSIQIGISGIRMEGDVVIIDVIGDGLPDFCTEDAASNEINLEYGKEQVALYTADGKPRAVLLDTRLNLNLDPPLGASDPDELSDLLRGRNTLVP